MNAFRIPSAFLILALLACTINAATRTWTGSNSALWSDAGNWGGTVPLAGDDLVFPAAALNTSNHNDLPNGTTLHSIVISGSGYSIEGNSIVLETGGITTTSSNATISLAIQLSGAQQWLATSGSLSVAGPLDLNGAVLTLAGSGALSGIVSSNGSITKIGSGQWTLSGANSFAGQVIVQAGWLIAANSSALGVGDNTAANGTVVQIAGTLRLAGASIANEHITLFGNQIGYPARLESYGTSNTLGGTVVLGSSTSIYGDLTISGSITGPGGLYYYGGNLVLTGINTSTGPLEVGPQCHVVIDGGSMTADTLVEAYDWGSGTLDIRNGAAVTGSVTVRGGILTVGPGEATVGKLTTQQSISTGGPQSPYYAQFVSRSTLHVIGAVQITSTDLSGSGLVIEKAGTDPVQGIFSVRIAGPPAPPFMPYHLGLTEGLIYPIRTSRYQITYLGGSGNDVVVTYLGIASTTTTIASSPNPSFAGQPVTFQIAITSPFGTPSAGDLEFYDGTTRIGGGGSSWSGTATWTTSGLSVGTHTITARYAADLDYVLWGYPEFAPSTSNVVVQVVNRAPSSIALTGPSSPSAAGQSVTFTAIVTGSAGTASGNVTFLDGTAPLGSVPLAAGMATFSTSSLGLGTHTITAAYAGSDVYAGSTSVPLTLVVSQCSYDLQPATVWMQATGGSGSIAIDAPSPCAWTAVSNASWIVLTPPVSGSGKGMIRYSVGPAPTISSRVGTISVAGRDVTLTQDGQQCSFTLSEAAASFPREGGMGSVSVTAPNGCNWNAITADDWIAIIDGQSGSGSGIIHYQITPNAASARSGIIAIAHQELKITQEGCPVSVAVNVAPADGARVSSPVTLQWSTVAEASGYHLCLTNAQGEDVVDVDTEATAMTLPLDAGPYSWFVSAIFGDCQPTVSTATTILVLPARRRPAIH